MEIKDTSSTKETFSLSGQKTRVSTKSSFSSERKKQEEDPLHGVPKHIEVINFVTKRRKNDLSWISDVQIPAEKIPFSKRKKSLQQRINKRKSRIDYIIPDDSEELGTLLYKINKTESTIRQDSDFLSKIRNLKVDIELKPAINKETKVKIKTNSKHSMLIAAPTKIPRSGIIFKGVQLY